MKNCFVILNYNDYETTIKLVNNIRNYDIIDEIVIVDNNSTDSSFEYLKLLISEKITVLKNSCNKGYSSGNNIGCKYLIEKYEKCNIFISNPDIIIKDEQSLINLLDTFKLDVGIVSPLILENNKYNRGWKLPTPFIDSLMNIPIIHNKVKENNLFYSKEHYNKDIVDVEVVSGCFFLIRSDVLKKVDFFDENVFLYYEENILGKKLKDLNIKSVVNTKVEVIHNHSVSIDKNVKKLNKIKILKKSQMYFEKHYNKANIFERALLYVTSKMALIIYFICGYR